MSNTENSYRYGYKDFIRYHQGKMSNEEMQQLEKAALEDAFIQDALDGYAYSTDSEKELEFIQSKIKDQTKQKGLILPFNQYKKFMSVAASIALMLIAGYFILKNNDENINDVQSQTPLIAKNEPPKNIPAVNDNEIKTELSPAIDNINIEEKPSVQPKPSSTLESTTVKDKNAETVIPKAESLPVKKFTTVELKENTETVAVANVTVLAADDETKMASIETDSKTPQPVVMMASTATEKRKLFTDSLSNIDQKNFQSFVTKNRNDYYDDNGNKILGRVILSFDTDEKGNPLNIKITQSLSENCDKEAIRLLKTAPKWSKTNSKNLSAAVEF